MKEDAHRKYRHIAVRWGFLCLALVVLVRCVAGEDRFSWLGNMTRARAMVLPIFVDAKIPAAAVLRVDKLSKGHQRRGFFRIGLFPMVIAEGVRLEVRDASVLAPLFLRVQKHLHPNGRNEALELRKVTIVFSPALDQTLSARKIQFGPEGQWELCDGVSLQIGQQHWQSTRAQWWVGGEQAGQLILDTLSGPVQLNLFAILSNGSTSTNYPTNQ